MTTKTYTSAELAEILIGHRVWLDGRGGCRADLPGADLRGANLRGTLLSGADLRDADLSGADLSDADLPGADLRRANLREADLSRANLTGADLRRADLSRADLSRADLSGANLTGADTPIVVGLDAAVLAAAEGGKLDMSDWHHDCGTTHCIAGWAITLAGDAGAVLEHAIGPSAAAALIYHASTGSVPDFYAGDDDAMASLVQRAAALHSAT